MVAGVSEGEAEGVSEGVGDGDAEGDAEGDSDGDAGGLGGRGRSWDRYAAVTQRALPSTTSSARSPDRRPVTRTFSARVDQSHLLRARSPDPVHRLSGAVVHRCSCAWRIAYWVCRAA